MSEHALYMDLVFAHEMSHILGFLFDPLKEAIRETQYNLYKE